MAGDAFYTSSKWKSTRTKVLKRDDHTCTFCGFKAMKGMHIDHIHERAKGGAEYDPDNLRTLCERCHSTRAKPRERARIDWLNSTWMLA